MSDWLQHYTYKTLLLVDNLAAAWNEHDLEKICAFYAENAWFLSKSGCVRGRENILAKYRTGYPNSSSMGTLSLEVIEYTTRDSPWLEPFLCSAIVRWKLSKQEGERSGMSLLVFRNEGDKIEILHDASL